MSARISEELVGIDLRDKRLDERSVSLIEAFHANPEASVNGSLSSWSETIAGYRFLGNAKVTPEGILRPHREATLRRVAEQPRALIVQDTTELDYSKHPPRDGRCLTKPDRIGFFLHPQLAVTPAGLPLGLIGSQTFDRDPESLGCSPQRAKRPLEEKESFRWLEGYRQANEVAQACPETEIVSVADCEADMYDIFLEAQQMREGDGPHAEYVIRSKENRRLDERVPPAEHDSRNVVYRKLRDVVSDKPVRFHRTIVLPATSKRKARQAELEIRAEVVTLKHPKNRRGLESVRCQVVYAQEVDAPATAIEEGSVVEWWLLTSLPIDSRDDIERVLDDYQSRWEIEVYFRTLKTGCRVEQLQLETTDRLQNCLAFYQIITWFTIYVTHLNREVPDMPCSAVFTDSEWKSVWRVTTGENPPPQPPTLAEFVARLASLGGYNNRKTEPPPGPQTIWVGIRRMLDFALAWETFGPDP